jgi:ferrous iron transport protein B
MWRSSLTAARVHKPALTAGEADPPATMRRVALLGNPNTGKTTLFNRLTGLRHKTSNFPGTTLEARIGRVRIHGGVRPAPAGSAAACACGTVTLRQGDAHPESSDRASGIELIDLPGIYSLELDQAEAEVCRAVLAGRAAPRGEPVAEPDAVCVVADATNLSRNLMFVGEALRRRLPTIVVVNMIDLARRRGIHIDPEAMTRDLGCPVVCASARTGQGLSDVTRLLTRPGIPTHTPPGDEAGLRAWADAIYECAAAGESSLDADSFTDRADRVFTHPVAGLAVFAIVMAGLFWVLFKLAAYPMEGIDTLITAFGGFIASILPEGVLRELLVGGVIHGVGATVIFLPQICLLFFVISLLEDTGYLARAAFVMDRALRPFGLPGHAFMPLLSSHACALPGIMATRAIPDRRERLATILVAPFMTCSARLPVYALVTSILFTGRPAMAALAFVGCYALGAAAGIVSALVARRTILKGASRPMALELPTYKWPSLRTACLTTYDRGMVFLKKAGTNILAISIILWWLSSFPHVDPPPEALALRQQAAHVSPDTTDDAASLLAQADRIERRYAAANSFAGRLGRVIQPAFAPLGYDWQLSVGILTSFAAREVFVSTMTVITTGQEDREAEGVLAQVAAAPRDDGTPIFTKPVGWSLLVYYVLAMQCLPTLAVTAKESGSWKWAGLQLAWMSGIAYLAAMAVYQVLA